MAAFAAGALNQQGDGRLYNSWGKQVQQYNNKDKPEGLVSDIQSAFHQDVIGCYL